VSEAVVLGRAEHVLLRYLAGADRRELLALRRRSREFVRPWEPAPPRGFDPFGATWFQRVLEGARREDSERLLVCRRDDDAIVGMVSLTQIFRGPFQNACVGYWVGAQHAGRGFMTEGLGLVLDHAFGRLGLHRVEANIRPENAPSLALVRRLGMRREGLSLRYLQIDGDWRDHERWAMLAEDWQALRSGARRKKA